MIKHAHSDGSDSFALFLDFAARLSLPPTHRAWKAWQRRIGHEYQLAVKTARTHRKLRAKLEAAGVISKG